MPVKPQFGDVVENLMASERNPLRVGRFVRVVDRRRRRMNPGLFWEVTDGKGEFWLSNPANCRVHANEAHHGARIAVDVPAKRP